MTSERLRRAVGRAGWYVAVAALAFGVAVSNGDNHHAVRIVHVETRSR